MIKFIPLQELQDQIWPLAVAKGLATDMTGVSLPLLDFTPGPIAHPYRAHFLLYYAVPDEVNPVTAPERVTRAYSWVTLDLQSGEWVEHKSLGAEDASAPPVGPGVTDEVRQLQEDERRALQDLFFELYDEAAQMYAEDRVTTEQAERLADLLDLFARFAEPPLLPDYEAAGQPFFTWLREHAQSASTRTVS